MHTLYSINTCKTQHTQTQNNQQRHKTHSHCENLLSYSVQTQLFVFLQHLQLYLRCVSGVSDSGVPGVSPVQQRHARRLEPAVRTAPGCHWPAKASPPLPLPLDPPTPRLLAELPVAPAQVSTDRYHFSLLKEGGNSTVLSR